MSYKEDPMSHIPHKKSLINISIINEPSYTAKLVDDFILIRTKGDTTITLPEGIMGKKFIIKNENTEMNGIYTIKPANGNTIDSMGSYEFSLPLESITLIFVENNWNIV